MKKRPNECFKCTSRACYEHVYSIEDCGKTYNEIACLRHVKDLHKDSDVKAPGIMKMFASSTGKLDRRDIGKKSNHV